MRPSVFARLKALDSERTPEGMAMLQQSKLSLLKAERERGKGSVVSPVPQLEGLVLRRCLSDHPPVERPQLGRRSLLEGSQVRTRALRARPGERRPASAHASSDAKSYLVLACSLEPSTEMRQNGAYDMHKTSGTSPTGVAADPWPGHVRMACTVQEDRRSLT